MLMPVITADIAIAAATGHWLPLRYADYDIADTILASWSAGWPDTPDVITPATIAAIAAITGAELPYFHMPPQPGCHYCWPHWRCRLIAIDAAIICSIFAIASLYWWWATMPLADAIAICHWLFSFIFFTLISCHAIISMLLRHIFAIDYFHAALYWLPLFRLRYYADIIICSAHYYAIAITIARVSH